MSRRFTAAIAAALLALGFAAAVAQGTTSHDEAKKSFIGRSWG